MARVAPYGSWASPLASETIVASSSPIREIAVEDDGTIWWTAQRPGDAGKTSLVRRRPDGSMQDVVVPPFDVRSRVHEYGGGAFFVDRGIAFFSNDADRRVYRVEPGKKPRPITPEGEARWADGSVDRRRNRAFLVRESHQSGEVINEIVSVDLGGEGPPRVVVSGADFYASPRINPDGTRLAFVCWDHPDMPWDSTDLCVADLYPDGSAGPRKHIAGGDAESAILPAWSPGGALCFVSDRTGYWNLYRQEGANAPEILARAEAEFASPPWVFGSTDYAVDGEERLLCGVNREGMWTLDVLDSVTRRRSNLTTRFTQINDVRVARGIAVLLAGSAGEPISVVRIDLESRKLDVLKRSTELAIDTKYLSTPRAIEFPTAGGHEAHALFYPPANADFVPPPGTKPPLIVMSHGGPTAAASSALKPEIQFFTSRGFAVVDVNYGGSSGYGRAYRERLDGKWGIVDVDDCAHAALWLAKQGEVDAGRLAIRGASAGGFTTLAALAFRDVFKAGASHFGVSDLESLARDTHKFEARYLDRLVGEYPARADVYKERSPLLHAEKITAPVIFFQGSEDQVVPPDQTRRMADALRKRGIPVAEIHFEGEGHGFRKKDNVKRALDAELFFYSQIFGFELADRVEPVKIDNLR